MSGILNIAIQSAYNAGTIIQQESRNLERIKVATKGHNDFVSEVDHKAEQEIIRTISKAFPEHNILGEETGLIDNGSEFTWIIDPLDGTTNYIHSHPQYAVSIGVKEGDKVIAGVVFDPNRNDIYTAEAGKGAKLNDNRIRVSKTTTLAESLLATGFPTYDMSFLDQYMAIFKEMITSTAGQRRAGSAALDLAYVASGAVDGYWEFNLKPWDIAAGYLLVKEAGGLICDFDGEQNMFNSGNIIAANPKMISQILKIIQNHR
ncbi:MAG: inositol monophosphatase family protein [Burkholderiales bacterium]|nr:inositol monophosphatase family protein [Burkholderiales bacterium]